MFSNLDLAVAFIYVCLGLIGFGVLILLMMKARSIILERKRAALLEKHQPYFVYLQRHIVDPDPFQPPKGPLSPLETRVIQDKLMEWIEKFRGAQRQKLTALCEDMDLVQLDRKQLSSMFYAKQMKAAYRLGGMRSAQAVEPLIELMKQEKDGPLLHVLARSVAKCAEHLDQLYVMLQQLTRHRKGNYLNAAEVLEETSLDVTPLLLQCMEDRDHNLVKTALLALRGQTGVTLTPALLRLADSDDKEIRSLAVKMLVRAGNILPEETICSWLTDPEGEIRAAVAESLGQFGYEGSIPALKQALTDSDWWVRYHSAKSLAMMGDAGFRTLCEAALERDDPFKSDMAKDRIHEELLREHFFANRRKQISGAHTKQSLYEQYFGQASSVPNIRGIGGDYSA
ncbi:HEAT repeat domain-containing protein [Paenibacillus sp. MER TA 81-3]|uniref:HEAT repeat domain-containing protein n=1 Tax=Paenibacillus sp. MER TA 81-3 TaxID=2939573 RepID=UPI00203EE925|nr:HEAT repeat domain-containing protein [Paenibacillus sp. MER TA 81-3]MCM3341862.1 HEAT repeat domain-containing protein [Paenibacillus sp. MER TA 81-3]